jgi:hypothetical protein
MNRSIRGDIALFAEMIVVVVLILGFLVAVQFQLKRPAELTPTKAAFVNADAKRVYPQADSRPSRSNVEGKKNLSSAVIPEITERTVPYEIVYTDSGFLPDIIEVESGNRVVVFRNLSTELMWVATDPYPINDDYPLFNQGKGVGPGESYWFAFPSGAKQYGYHNQLHPGHWGRIIVK